MADECVIRVASQDRVDRVYSTAVEYETAFQKFQGLVSPEARAYLAPIWMGLSAAEQKTALHYFGAEAVDEVIPLLIKALEAVKGKLLFFKERSVMYLKWQDPKADVESNQTVSLYQHDIDLIPHIIDAYSRHEYLVAGRLICLFASRDTYVVFGEFLIETSFTTVVTKFNLHKFLVTDQTVPPIPGITYFVHSLTGNVITALRSLAFTQHFALELGEIELKQDEEGFCSADHFVFNDFRHMCLFPQNFQAFTQAKIFKKFDKEVTGGNNAGPRWRKRSEAVHVTLTRMKRFDPSLSGAMPRRLESLTEITTRSRRPAKEAVFQLPAKEKSSQE